MLDAELFGATMKRLFATCPRRRDEGSLDRKAVAASYWEDLYHLDDAVFEEAVRRHRRSSPFFPAVSELLDQAREVRRERAARERAETLALPAPSPTLTRAGYQRFRRRMQQLRTARVGTGQPTPLANAMEGVLRGLERTYQRRLAQGKED